MIRRRLLLGYALVAAVSVSCGRDEPAPSNVIKAIVVPPRDTAAMKAHGNDSAFVVLRAAASLDKIQGQQVLRVTSYQRTDSGTLVSMLAMCGPDYKSVCIGGGGRVFVDSVGRARVVQLFR